MTREQANGRQRMERSALQRILEARALEEVSVEQIFRFFREDEDLAHFRPDALCQIDPRDGAMILYNSARAHRPHDQHAPLVVPGEERDCPICEGQTTGVIDVTDLSEGFTFINKNLFPIIHALDGVGPEHAGEELTETHQGLVAHGLHFLQWTSSYHDRGWHNMGGEDRLVVMKRLAALEAKLLFEAGELMPQTDVNVEGEARGYVSIIKNYGARVGGSLSHDHQQIAFSNVMPQRFFLNKQFEERRGERFTEFLLNENPDELLVRDYGEAALVVPYFMRRPYNMILALKDPTKKYLCELSEGELQAVADAWHDAIDVILRIMPLIGKETAFNVTVHNGPGAGLYVEFLPFTQETGGFEQLGLWVCQGNTQDSAATLREMMEGEKV
ncbi:MAG: hypothetical protein R3248_06920 [Candidatus Promineifilaceae bacterium]|nr:hypothetical protein [Candidatus Promineifilaceae bacterium]